LMDARAVFNMAFMLACLGWRPALLPQWRPWVPEASTWFPHKTHWWGEARGTPRRKPTAILTESSSIRRPSDETGGALSQAPDSFLCEASKRALSTAFAEESRDETVALMMSISHDHCLVVVGPIGGLVVPQCGLCSKETEHQP
jgi:hypothetical protein